MRRETKRELLKHDLNKLTKKQLATLNTKITKISNDIFKEANVKMEADMAKFAIAEADFNLKMLDQATIVPLKTASQSAIDTLVFKTGIDLGEGGTIKLGSALSQFNTDVKRNVTRAIRRGIAAGDSNATIRRSLNTVAKGIQKARAASLIRTITNHTSTSAKTAVYKANSDVVEAERYTATLDSRTTAECGGLDGKVFPIGKGPLPPIHWNCRSVRTPIIKKEFDVIPQVKTQRVARGASGKTTLVGGKETYNSWLGKQPKNFQQEVLGKSRAKLFRDGGLKIDKFTDDNFRNLNLKELRKLEPLAFEKAGL